MSGVGAEPLRVDQTAPGPAMMTLLRELYPGLRSITGEGLRRSLHRLRRELPDLRLRSVPSGTEVYDWIVPPEWNVREAYVADRHGRRRIDVAQHTLHLVGYSVPFRGRLTLDELRPHLHTLPDRPNAVPYRTSYFRAAWGFCLRHSELERLDEGPYDVVVDTTLDPRGRLDFAELVLHGSRQDEVLFSAHVCHPSLANDNLSAVVVLVELARWLAARPDRRLTYRFVFAPATIGALAFLGSTPEAVARMRHGLVVAGVGDGGRHHYKRSERGAPVDGVLEHVLAERGDHVVLPFAPTGYDERQYNSPGFRLPVGRLSRTPFGEYAEYHTSDDHPSFVRPEALEDTLDLLRDVVEVFERDVIYVSTAPFGEPALGRRGLYGDLGGVIDRDELHQAVLWVLNQADGATSLLDVARRSGLPFRIVVRAARVLCDAGLLRAEEIP